MDMGITGGGKIRLGDVKPGDVIDPGNGPTPRALLHAFAELVEPTDLVEVHSIDPWWISQSHPNCERVAAESLMREGFEAWYPTYRHFVPKPLRKIASHMRHKYRDKVECRIKPLFPGYVLLRRAAARHVPVRLFELRGCSGLCVFDGPDGPQPATISDVQVEMLRLRVDNHGATGSAFPLTQKPAWRTDDVMDRVSDFAVIKSGILEDPKVKNPWAVKGRVAGKLDESLGLSLFIVRGDRTVRVIRSDADVKRASVPR